jgi:hypothetical protein
MCHRPGPRFTNQTRGTQNFPTTFSPGHPPDCIRAHEERHIKDSMAAVPDICKGKPAGTVIGSSGLLHNKIEIAGYAVEITCLLKKLEGLQDCDACKKITTIRIKQVRKERDKNK